ncbi:MAG: hypothetical protein AAFP19_09250 [Bacteroidota bacterium]
MKKLIFALMVCGLFATEASAQKEETIFGRSGLRLSGAWGGPQTMITRMGDDNALLNGGFGGLEFNKSVFIGWGAYRLEDNVRLMPQQDQLDMDYNGLILGFNLAAHKAVHARAGVMGAFGDVGFKDGPNDRIYVIQPSAGIEVNIFRWFHIELEGGYRFVDGVETEGIVDSDLSDIYGAIRFKFGWSWGRNRRYNRDADW